MADYYKLGTRQFFDTDISGTVFSRNGLSYAINNSWVLTALTRYEFRLSHFLKSSELLQVGLGGQYLHNRSELSLQFGIDFNLWQDVSIAYNVSTDSAFYYTATQQRSIVELYGGIDVPFRFKTSKDTDNDGIKDSKDDCPTRPETKNGFQDKDGCPDRVPLKDSDGDGIKDDVDKCIYKKEIFNGLNDEDGCPDEIRVKRGEKRYCIVFIFRLVLIN